MAKTQSRLELLHHKGLSYQPCGMDHGQNQKDMLAREQVRCKPVANASLIKYEFLSICFNFVDVAGELAAGNSSWAHTLVVGWDS